MKIPFSLFVVLWALSFWTVMRWLADSNLSIFSL
jgi:hypothetical protein